MENINAHINCNNENITAYLDEEMTADDIVCFENHISICKSCADELQTQKRIFNELDFAFDSQKELLPLPLNFTKVIKANAESDMNGLRQHEEKSRALRLCFVLALLSFVLLGWARFSDSVFVPIKKLVGVAGSLLETVWNLVYDIGLGTVVIVRTVSRHFLFESNSLTYILIVIFLCSILLLSRLIRRYHNA